MKYLFSIFLVVLCLFSYNVSAQDEKVTILLNKQTYQFEQPVRLSDVLSIVADSGEWYWPSSAVYNLQDTTAQQKKEGVVSEIKALLAHYDSDSDTYRALQNLLKQVSSWTVSTRVSMPVSYNRARLFFEHNPMFQPGKYWVRLNSRPNVVHFSGAVVKPGAYQHSSDTSMYYVVHGVEKMSDADRSYVFIIDPMGNIEKKGAAYWNVDFSQIMPGGQVFVPLLPELFSSKLDALNERVAELAVHRVLPQ